MLKLNSKSTYTIQLNSGYSIQGKFINLPQEGMLYESLNPQVYLDFVIDNNDLLHLSRHDITSIQEGTVEVVDVDNLTTPLSPPQQYQRSYSLLMHTLLNSPEYSIFTLYGIPRKVIDTPMELRVKESNKYPCSYVLFNVGGYSLGSHRGINPIVPTIDTVIVAVPKGTKFEPKRAYGVTGHLTPLPSSYGNNAYLLSKSDYQFIRPAFCSVFINRDLAGTTKDQVLVGNILQNPEMYRLSTENLDITFNKLVTLKFGFPPKRLVQRERVPRRPQIKQDPSQFEVLRDIFLTKEDIENLCNLFAHIYFAIDVRGYTEKETLDIYTAILNVFGVLSKDKDEIILTVGSRKFITYLAKAQDLPNIKAKFLTEYQQVSKKATGTTGYIFLNYGVVGTTPIPHLIIEKH